MMPNHSTDILFQLIHSLHKAEKRNFKLYIQRNSANKELKIIELFDAIDKLKEYDETALLKKVNKISKSQLSNLKIHLYKQILASLRILKSTDSLELQLNEQLDHARILYNKGLYNQALKILEKAKEIANEHHQFTYLIQIISFEKNIESLHITRSIQNRADQLTKESHQINIQRSIITDLSNLALQLYSWYIKNGHARTKDDERLVKKFFFEKLPHNYIELDGFYERLYIYQSFSWYAYIRQDFLMYYKYTQKWVDLFDTFKNMVYIEPLHYIKGMHNLLNAHFDVRNHKKFAITLNTFEHFYNSPATQYFDNTRIQTFIYLYSAKLNQHIVSGKFDEALNLLPTIEFGLKQYYLYVDKHRVLVMNYKMSMVYFGAGNYSKSIDYLHKIINNQIDLRIDLQCYARLLHLIAHYELGNTDLIEYLTKSVYRFMAKMNRFSIIEEQIFSFLRNSFHINRAELRQKFEQLLIKLKGFEKMQFETRTFAYLDIISWLESKVYEKSMAEIIRNKYLESKR